MEIIYFKVVCNKGKFGVIKWRIVINSFKTLLIFILNCPKISYKYHIGRKILN
ncbi:hypothetical protein HpNP126_08930 [Helicobacter pylori]